MNSKYIHYIQYFMTLKSPNFLYKLFIKCRSPIQNTFFAPLEPKLVNFQKHHDNQFFFIILQNLFLIRRKIVQKSNSLKIIWHFWFIILIFQKRVPYKCFSISDHSKQLTHWFWNLFNDDLKHESEILLLTKSIIDSKRFKWVKVEIPK